MSPLRVGDDVILRPMGEFSKDLDGIVAKLIRISTDCNCATNCKCTLHFWVRVDGVDEWFYAHEMEKAR